MLIEREKGQLNNSMGKGSAGKDSKGMVLGFDLGKYSVQISFFRPGMEGPETAEQVTGSEVFNIPMVLCKRQGINQWFYGREALKYHQKEGGILVDHLLQRAIDGECEDIEGERVDGIALLTLFIKRSLSILGGVGRVGGISDIMFTCENLDDRVVEVMSTVAANLQIRNCNIYFQSYAESIYHYMIHQDPQLWNNPVVMSHYDGKRVVNYIFKKNPRTSPMVVFVGTGEEYQLQYPQIISEESRKAAFARLDEQYTDYMKEQLGMEIYSSVYLLGDGFKDDWMDKTIKLLCHNRRLFIGNDIFSRGACYACQDKYNPTKEALEHVYLGSDKLRSNIGINVLRQGEESYLALLDAGINWYEVKCEYEMFLAEDFKLNFVIIPLDGGVHTEREIQILNPPERDADSFRVLLQMYMSDVSTVKIHIKDLGFGELYPSSEMEWDFELKL